MSPKSRGRPKGRGRDQTKKKARPVRELTQLDHVLREARSLEGEDLLVARLIASGWLGLAWHRQGIGQTDGEITLVREVIRAAVRGRKPAAYLALWALSSIAGDDWAEEVATALEAAPEGSAPSWARGLPDSEPPRPLRAFSMSDPWDTSMTLMVELAEPTPHALVVNYLTVGGHYVTTIEVGVNDGKGDPGDNPELTSLDPDVAMATIGEVVWETGITWPRNDDDGYVAQRAYAAWLTRSFWSFEDHLEMDEGLSDEERAETLDAFAEATGRDRHGDDIEIIADTFIDFGEASLHSGGTAWGPLAIEAFLLDWLPRKVILDDDDDARAVPDVLEDWVTFMLRRRGVEEIHVAEAAAVVDQLRDQYDAAMRDSSLGGPAKEIMTRALAAGVDLHDQDEMDEIISAYNAEQNARRLLGE
jgi:hypothetical protein